MLNPAESLPLPESLEQGEFTPPPPEVRTLEAFWDKWGDSSGMTREQFSQMWGISARRIGENEYGYHNEEHPREMLWVAMSFVDALEAQGYKPNRKVIIGSVMYHDDSIHEDHEALGFASKEEYAAERFEADAHLYDYHPEEIGLGKEVIITTRRKEIPKTIEGVVMVVADIWNVGADYIKDFQPHTLGFADEIRQKMESKGQAFNMSAFLANSINVLSDYVWSLISQKVCDVDKFVRQAAPNLFNLARDAAKLDGVTIDEYIRKLNNPIFNRILGHYKIKDKKIARNDLS